MNEERRAPGGPAPEPIGELHPVADEPDADASRGRWTPRNLPLAAGTLVVMVAAIVIILVIAFQLVPS